METVFLIGVIFSVVTSVQTKGCFSQRDLTMCTKGLKTTLTTLYIDTYNEALVNNEVKCRCELSSIQSKALVQVNILPAGKYSNYHLEVGGTDYTGKNTTRQFGLLKKNPNSIDFEISPIPTKKTDIPRLCLEINVKTNGVSIKVACDEIGNSTNLPKISTTIPKYENFTQDSVADKGKKTSKDNSIGDGVLIAVICPVGAVLLASAVAVTVVYKRRKQRPSPSRDDRDRAKSEEEEESDNLMTENELYNCEMAMSVHFQQRTTGTTNNSALDSEAVGHSADTEDRGIYTEVDENEDNAEVTDEYNHLNEIFPKGQTENVYNTADFEVQKPSDSSERQSL